MPKQFFLIHALVIPPVMIAISSLPFARATAAAALWGALFCSPHFQMMLPRSLRLKAIVYGGTAFVALGAISHASS